ncbi:MAG: nucleotidyltransferase domain-containing protein [Defluviitaleaceae bacterium]|nr:nucleotidyltransferase domain-containing protein [Defluviitaleaceae bacterium]
MRDSSYTIDEIKTVITPVAREYDVKRISVFGSYARGEATSQSDIDFHLIETGVPWGYFKLCGFRQDLEDRLGISVDVLTSGAMANDILESVRRDEVLLFEQ